MVGQRGELDGRRAARAVGIVVQRPGRGVVDDAVIGIVRHARPGGSMKAHITCRKGAHRADGGEDGVVQLEQVLCAVEVGDTVHVGAAQRVVKLESIRARVAGERIVAGAAVQLVVAGPAQELVVAGAAFEGVVAGAPAQGVFAAVSEQGVIAGSAI